MRLRNKKTGKIWHMPRLRQPTVQEDDISFFACISEHGCSRGELFSYKTLDELNEDWEDYKPTEPLIKDEKIRKVVRAWAEMHNIKKVFYCEYSWKNNIAWMEDAGDYESMINGESLCIDIPIIGVKNREYYTIAELCGEKEE